MPTSALRDPPARKSFRHAGEEARRAALIAAALECIAEGGLPAATVREIAARADVTQGLIRHYFPSKDDLIASAYQALMDRLAGDAEAASPPRRPIRRAARRVRARRARAGGGRSGAARRLGRLRRRAAPRPGAAGDPRGELPRLSRQRLEGLIAAALAAAGRAAGAAAVRRHAIAVNAVLDGLVARGRAAARELRPGRARRARPRRHRGDPRPRPRHQRRSTAMRYARVTESLARHGSAKWAVHERAKALRAAGRPVILLTIGEPDLPPSPQADRRARRGAGGRAHRLFQRPRRAGAARGARAQSTPARSGRAIGPESDRLPSRHPDRALRGDAHPRRGRATRCWSATRCTPPTRA